MIDEDDIVTQWFARHGVCLALVRPDHYVYGVAADSAAFDQIVDAFNNSLERDP